MLRSAGVIIMFLIILCCKYSKSLKTAVRVRVGGALHTSTIWQSIVSRQTSLALSATSSDSREGGRRASSSSSGSSGGKADYRNRNNRSSSNTGRGSYKGQKDKDDGSISEPVSKEVLAALTGPTVVLERGKARLFQDGNPLVYGGAVKMVVNEPAVGEEVRVVDHFGNLLGRGFFNPLSQYRVRMMVRAEEGKEIGLKMDVLIQRRVLQAAALRRSVGLPSESSNVYRLVNGEGDRLGGLIIDVIGSTVVVQSSALWVEAQKATVEKVVMMAVGEQCRKLVWKRVESRLRQDGYDGVFDDEVVGDGAGREEVVVESGAKFVVSAEDGQKTGFYCDQRENRQMLRKLSAGKTVLDAYCYTGGFSINMALGGASKVLAVDSSQLAVDTLSRNAALNGVQGVVEVHKADALVFMQRLADEGQQFDIVVLDPPKLAPSRADLDRARVKYAKINALGLRLVRPGGLLLTCTCSAACTQSGEFVSIVASAARQARRDVTVLAQAGAAPDHPVHSGYAEGRYLTAVLAAVA